mmetsp:Transcript_40828/g.123009  ORF Transcript_40828/g.123009 Transcript_40828/m.123009 type:complete len:205 (-) Transcript_40828:1601-2215(-)
MLEDEPPLLQVNTPEPLLFANELLGPPESPRVHLLPDAVGQVGVRTGKVPTETLLVNLDSVDGGGTLNRRRPPLVFLHEAPLPEGITVPQLGRESVLRRDVDRPRVYKVHPVPMVALVVHDVAAGEELLFHVLPQQVRKARQAQLIRLPRFIANLSGHRRSRCCRSSPRRRPATQLILVVPLEILGRQYSVPRPVQFHKGPLQQ